ncbi:hypothetical protein [Vibrio sinensis]|nr:hypothetical protein [Vibrio sinensis]
MSNNSDNFTQKDLMMYLLDTAQHAATRENLQTLEANLNIRIDQVRDELKEVRAELKQDIADVRGEVKDVRTELKEVRNKMDRMTWAICGTIIVAAVTVIFKDVLLSGLIS